MAATTAALPRWADAACGGDLFSTGPWFRHFAATALDAQEHPFYVLSGGTPNEPASALALKTTRTATFPRARMLESMTSYYSCGYGPVSAEPHSGTVLSGLVEALCEAGRRVDGVQLGPLDRGSPFAQACESALRAAGFTVYWVLAYRNWYATTAGMGYADYLKRVPSSFPATSEKRRQAFLRKAQGTISITHSSDGLEEQLAAYDHVYRESWKVPEPYPAFMPGLVRLAASQGWLRLGVLRVNGAPAAAQLWFVADGRALIYKVAYVEQHAKLSVGSMLSCAMLQHAIDVDRVREVDFLSGDDPYKAKWMFERRDRHTLMAFNPRRWRGLVAGLRESLAQRRDALRAAEVPSAEAKAVDA